MISNIHDHPVGVFTNLVVPALEGLFRNDAKRYRSKHSFFVETTVFCEVKFIHHVAVTCTPYFSAD